MYSKSPPFFLYYCFSNIRLHFDILIDGFRDDVKYIDCDFFSDVLVTVAIDIPVIQFVFRFKKYLYFIQFFLMWATYSFGSESM